MSLRTQAEYQASVCREIQCRLLFVEAAYLPKGSHRALGVVLVLCSAFIGCVAHAQPALTFDQALRLAQERSRNLVAQDYAASAAREMAIAAGQLPDPTLTAGINNLPINGPDQFSLTRDFMTMRSISVMQELTRSDKRQARAARFEREAEVAQAGRTQALANLQRDTALAWLDRYYQERMREVLVTQRDEARLQVEAADAAYRGARGSQADVFAARTAVAQIEDRLAQADRQIASAKTRLARWIGDAASLPLGPTPSMEVVRIDLDRRRSSRASSADRPAAQAGTGGTRRSGDRPGKQAGRLERGADVQPAWTVLLEHDLDQLLDPVAARPQEPAGPRTRCKAGADRSVAGAA